MAAADGESVNSSCIGEDEETLTGDEAEEFTCGAHCSELAQRQNEHRKAGLFCDLTLLFFSGERIDPKFGRAPLSVVRCVPLLLLPAAERRGLSLWASGADGLELNYGTRPGHSGGGLTVHVHGGNPRNQCKCTSSAGAG